jgi:hypothetical protein
LESIQEWSDIMKTSSLRDFRSIGGKIMTGFVFAAIIGSMNVAPALGRDDNRKGGTDKGRNGQRDRGHDRGRHVQGRREYRTDGYGEQVYIPPPVVYEPPSPPGISIFFPPIVIR